MASPLKGPGIGFKLDLAGVGRSAAPLPPPSSSIAVSVADKANLAATNALGITVSDASKVNNTISAPRSKIPPPIAIPKRPEVFEQAPSTFKRELEGEKVLNQLVAEPAKTAVRAKSSPSSQQEKLISLVREGTRQGISQELRSQKNEEFKAIVKSLPADQAPKIIPKLLKELAYEERGKEYDFMIKNLRDLYPKIDLYIKHMVVDNFEADMLSGEGLRTMVTKLQDKGSLRMPCVVCENYEQMHEEIKKLAESSGDVRMGFIVRNQKKDLEEKKPNYHVTPIYVEKKENSFKMAITDSLGNNEFYTRIIASDISKQLNSAGKEVVIYCYVDSSRQGKTDRTNCPIFSLRDLAQLSKMADPIDFLKDAAKKIPADEQSKIPTIVHFKKLPPDMMKMTQSCEGIQRYDKEFGENVFRNSQNAKHIVYKKINDNEKPLNYMAEQRFLKYQRLLVAQAISESLKSPLP